MLAFLLSMADFQYSMPDIGDKLEFERMMWLSRMFALRSVALFLSLPKFSREMRTEFLLPSSGF
jgi:hypothetical protein